MQALELQSGLENSLGAMLDSAVAALDDMNAQNDGAAVNSMLALAVTRSSVYYEPVVPDAEELVG